MGEKNIRIVPTPTVMLVPRVAAIFLSPPFAPNGGCRGPFHRPPHPLPNGYLDDAKWVQLLKPGSVQFAKGYASLEKKCPRKAIKVIQEVWVILGEEKKKGSLTRLILG